jgi:hypothetical protein
VQAKPYDSHFWRGLMKIKELVLSCGSFMVKDGTQIRFWEDTWVGMTPLKQQFSTIFNIAHDPHATVASVMGGEQYNISFRRALVDDKLREWLELMGKINNVSLDNGRDMFRCDLNITGTFSVRSMYLHLLNQHAPFRHKFIWKLKIPFKIKIFLWYLERGIILTKDNLGRKNWKGSQKCFFCNANETIKHLLFDCHHAKQIWRIVYLATGLSPPKTVSHMFGNWLHFLDYNMKKITMTGVAALCWAIWRCRNDIIFNNTKYSSFM